jgi:RNA polymerase sigma-70 factor, ECF subfamily
MARHLADESRLVAAAKQGNEDAFRALVEQYYRNIYNLVRKIARNHEDTEDAVQWALFKAYSNLGQFHGNSRIYTWLVRIAVNEALMKLRKNRANKEVPLEELVQCDPGLLCPEADHWTENPERYYADIETHEIIRRALKGLSPGLYSAFLLRNVDDLSMRETAEALGLSVSAVKSRLVRARSRLRRRLRAVFRANRCSDTAYKRIGGADANRACLQIGHDLRPAAHAGASLQN